MFQQRNLKLIILAIFVFAFTFLQSQMIVKINKGSHQKMNLLESLNLSMCFEMNDYIVVAIEAEETLTSKNIAYEILTKNHQADPLVIISHNTGYEYALSSSVPQQFRSNDTKIIPVTINKHTYKNVKQINYSTNFLNAFTAEEREIITNSVNADTLASYIIKLESFVTRYPMAENRFEISQWIADQFTRFGYTSVEKPLFYGVGYWGHEAWQENVVATLEGSLFPDHYLIIGGHHDSILNNFNQAMNFAPGADDNATGTAAVLEMARVFKLHNFQPNISIRFITFAMEELGLVGSRYDAEKMIEDNIKVMGMINMDMIGNQPPSAWKFLLYNYTTGDYLRDVAMLIGTEMGLDVSYNNDGTSGSDSWSYHSVGIPSLYFAEHTFSPHWHLTSDTFENVNIEYTEQYVKYIASVVLSISDMIITPDSYVVYDLGTGNSLRAEWNEINLNSLSYKIAIINKTTQVTTEYETSASYIEIGGLTEYVLYEIILQSIYNGQVGPALSRHIILSSYPKVVEDFTHKSDIGQINFVWNANTDYALLGYNIYRKIDNDEQYSLLETISKNQTTYTDTSTQEKIWYNYKISAFFENGNESPDSNIIRARHLFLSDGVQILDLTLNTTFNPLAPPHEQVYDFYQTIVPGSVQQIKYEDVNEISIEELGIYTTTIIHKSSYNTNRSDVLTDVIKTIIDNGGNIIYSANNPMHLMAAFNSYPFDFISTDFPNEYFKINNVNSNSTARFAKGVSTNFMTLPNLEVDITKLPENNNETLNRLEVFGNGGFQVLYTYSSDSSDPTEAAFNGLPVALYTTKGKSHIIITSIPLFFIKEHQAKEFITEALNYFEVEVSATDNPSLVAKGLNLKNYPNPFNPETTIEFTLPADDYVEINIFNIRGQIVKNFSKEKYLSGVNVFQFDGNDLSSGVYFYQVKTEQGLRETKRLVLMK